MHSYLYDFEGPTAAQLLTPEPGLVDKDEGAGPLKKFVCQIKKIYEHIFIYHQIMDVLRISIFFTRYELHLSFKYFRKSHTYD